MEYDVTFLSLLYACHVPENVINHCMSVARYVSEVSLRMRKAGIPIDPRIATNGALLHDIGRSVTHSVRHGVEGARILRARHLPECYALICERHIGAGITRDEAVRLGLPPKDYLPVTWEEKVVAHCDNCTFGERRVPVTHTLERFSHRVDAAVLERIKLLNQELEPYM
jgi:uncharacterized protein